MSSSIQLSSADGYDVNRMVFSKPVIGNVKDTSINFRRINISTKYDDGTIGPLVFQTGRVFSFGPSENIDPTTKKINGYSFPLCLFNKDGPSKEEKQWVQTFNNVVDRCKKNLLDKKVELKLHDLEPSDLKKFNPLYYKKVDGTIVDGAGPTLYAKLIVSKKGGEDRIVSEFFDTNGNPLNALDILKKYCHTTAAVMIESIFLGNKISLQVKLYEAEVELAQTGMRKLLPRSRPQAESKVEISNSVEDEDVDEVIYDDKDVIEDSSIKSEDDEELVEPEPVKALPKKTVKKVVPKKKA